MPSRLSSNSRVSFAQAAEAGQQGRAAEILTPDFLEYVVELHDRFNGRVKSMRDARQDALDLALLHGIQPRHLPPSKATTTDWKVPQLPSDLLMAGIEISGPVGITDMFINALNPQSDGSQAEGDLADDEDSGGHTLADTVNAAYNRKHALLGSLECTARGKQYKLTTGRIPFFMHRERGLHLDESEFCVDGCPISATILGTACTLYHAGAVHAKLGKPIMFYIPKTESPEETRLYADIFAASQQLLPHLHQPKQLEIRAIILIESLPAVWYMEEMLYALGPYAAGLNAARWDLKASLLEYVMMDRSSIWPDRFGVDIKTTPFLKKIFQRLVAVCLKHGAVAVGGMATMLPSKDQAVNEAAAKSITADKEWEANLGFIRGWTAHIYHQKTAAAPFKASSVVKNVYSGNVPKELQPMFDPANFPVQIEVPPGAVTEEGTRRNVRMLLEYIEGWMRGRGAKGIDSLAGKSGIHPALMEDLATARMSVAQVAQRVVNSVQCSDTGHIHDLGLVCRLLDDEMADILARLPQKGTPTDVEAYRQARQISLRWLKKYIDLDFTSLGQYTRDQLKAWALRGSL